MADQNQTATVSAPAQQQTQGTDNTASWLQAGSGLVGGALDFFLYWDKKKVMRQAVSEARTAAAQARSDYLGQQTIANQFTAQGLQQNQQAFDFGKEKWGAEFGLTKEQYRDQKKRQTEMDTMAKQDRTTAIKKSAVKSLVDNMNQTLGDDLQMKQFMAQNLSR